MLICFSDLRESERNEETTALISPILQVEGIFSPVSSAYVHKPLAKDEHRVAMLQKVR